MDLQQFISDFLNDPKEQEAFISGPAGSGKTTSLINIIEYLNKNEIAYQVTAYTHKATEVLKSKLPPNTPISTLHSWLKKRPSLNTKATNINNVMVSRQYGKPQPLQLLIVDEYSFVGERDYWSIGELQDPNLIPYKCPQCSNIDEGLEEVFKLSREAKCSQCGYTYDTDSLQRAKAYEPLKVLYIGDEHQLQPVKDIAAVRPSGTYQIHLDTIHRQDSEDLLKISQQVRQMIATNTPTKLQPSEHFKRGVDIVQHYIDNASTSKRLLAYTNLQVQHYNKTIEEQMHGAIVEEDLSNRVLYNYTIRQELMIKSSQRLTTDYKFGLNDSILACDNKTFVNALSRFSPLQTIIEIVKLYPSAPFYLLNTNKGQIIVILGTYSNKAVRQDVNRRLVEANQQHGFDSTKSKKAYKIAKVLNDIVHKVDFNHCQTIHTTQGQEYDHIYIDIKDVTKAPNYLNLLYVGVTRAKQYLYFNA